MGKRVWEVWRAVSVHESLGWVESAWLCRTVRSPRQSAHSYSTPRSENMEQSVTICTTLELNFATQVNMWRYFSWRCIHLYGWQLFGNIRRQKSVSDGRGRACGYILEAIGTNVNSICTRRQEYIIDLEPALVWTRRGRKDMQKCCSWRVSYHCCLFIRRRRSPSIRRHTSPSVPPPACCALITPTPTHTHGQCFEQPLDICQHGHTLTSHNHRPKQAGPHLSRSYIKSMNVSLRIQLLP